MADTVLEKFMRCAEVCGFFFFFLIVLIGWAGELQSHGFYCMRTHAWILDLDGLCSHLTWEDLDETALQSSISKVEGTKCNHD